MQGQTANIVMQAIHFIEDNLTDKIELKKVASALHYSKYHLHRVL